MLRKEDLTKNAGSLEEGYADRVKEEWEQPRYPVKKGRLKPGGRLTTYN